MREQSLLSYEDQLTIQQKDGQTMIFDPVRRKYVALQPEELVRQLLIQYLLLEKGISRSRIAVERQISVLNFSRRFDLLVYDQHGRPQLLIECKAPGVSLSEDVFHQIARYNYALQVPFLLISNGIESFYFYIDYVQQSFEQVEDVLF